MPIPDARKRANRKYNDKAIKNVTLSLNNNNVVSKESLQKWAKNAGMSVNKYVITAILKKQ